MSVIRNFALAALAAAALAGSVQAQSSATPATPRTGAYNRGQGRGSGGFRNLDLTDAQKSQIKAIRAKYQPQLVAARNATRPLMDSARAARQRGDTATARADMQRARSLMQSNTARTQEQAEIRSILTPAQQAKFDADMKKRQERAGKRGQHRGRGAFRKGRPTANGV